MTFAFIANIATSEELEMSMDEANDSLELLASPQFNSISHNCTEDWVAKQKLDLIALLYFGEPEDYAEVVWEDSGWNTPSEGRPNKSLTAKIEDEIVGLISIQMYDIDS